MSLALIRFVHNNWRVLDILLPQVVDRLCTLRAHPGVGGAGIRDVLAAHCKGMEGSDARVAIALCILESLPKGPEPDKSAQLEFYLSILAQLSVECPEAFRKKLDRFVEWLQCPSGSKESSLALPMAACNILAQVLPSWATTASSLAKQKVTDSLAGSGQGEAKQRRSLNFLSFKLPAMPKNVREHGPLTQNGLWLAHLL